MSAVHAAAAAAMAEPHGKMRPVPQAHRESALGPLDSRRASVTSGWTMTQMDSGPTLDGAEPGAAHGSKVMRAGWVYKRGDWSNPAFKKRWFVLRGGRRPMLAYYKRREDPDDHRPAKGYILVEGMKVAADTGSADGPEGQVECFAISAAGSDNDGSARRRILCACESQDEREAWTRELRTAAASCDKPDEVARPKGGDLKQSSFGDLHCDEAWASPAWSIPSSDAQSLPDQAQYGSDAGCGFSDESKAWLYPGNRARRANRALSAHAYGDLHVCTSYYRDHAGSSADGGR